MKLKAIISIALVMLLFQGCIVKSLHPFYSKKDLTFRKELLTTWEDQDGGKWNIHASKDSPNAYEMHWSKPNAEEVVFLSHLFTLDDQLYFDFFPVTGTGNTMAIFDMHMMPTHSIAKVQMLTDQEVHILWFNEEWLKLLFDENRIKISHEVVNDETQRDSKAYVLTASTEELQKFILKFGKDPRAFMDTDNGDDNVWLRLKKI